MSSLPFDIRCEAKSLLDLESSENNCSVSSGALMLLGLNEGRPSTVFPVSSRVEEMMPCLVFVGVAFGGSTVTGSRVGAGAKEDAVGTRSLSCGSIGLCSRKAEKVGAASAAVLGLARYSATALANCSAALEPLPFERVWMSLESS